ncbi:MAG: signal peptidase I [Desulfonauticus sp.]|nr:signal peptidase I [Desulfonauticus sp.]
MNEKWRKIFGEYLEAFVIAFILAFFIRSFVVQAFKIPSGSMLNTLQIGDHLLVNKFIYGLRIPFTNKFIVKFSGPKFRDVIVFKFPEDPSKDFIKRVIGVPGDTIQIIHKIVYRNGKKLTEPYAIHVDPHFIPQRDDFGPITVPKDKYFVMGDNRDESYDSRFWGFVDRDLILGKAFIIYWSWEGFTHIRWNRIGKIIH